MALGYLLAGMGPEGTLAGRPEGRKETLLSWAELLNRLSINTAADVWTACPHMLLLLRRDFIDFTVKCPLWVLLWRQRVSLAGGKA